MFLAKRKSKKRRYICNRRAGLYVSGYIIRWSHDNGHAHGLTALLAPTAQVWCPWRWPHATMHAVEAISVTKHCVSRGEILSNFRQIISEKTCVEGLKKGKNVRVWICHRCVRGGLHCGFVLRWYRLQAYRIYDGRIPFRRSKCMHIRTCSPNAQSNLSTLVTYVFLAKRRMQLFA